MLPLPWGEGGVQVAHGNQQPPHGQDLLELSLCVFTPMLGGGAVPLGRAALCSGFCGLLPTRRH